MAEKIGKEKSNKGLIRHAERCQLITEHFTYGSTWRLSDAHNKTTRIQRKTDPTEPRTVNPITPLHF